MILSEFKAWFEGFTESMEGAPTEKQFARIKEQVSKIDGAPISRTVFIDHYRHYWNQPFWGTQVFGGTSLEARSSAGGVGNISFSDAKTIDAAWDAHSAMFAVGKADALAS